MVGGAVGVCRPRRRGLTDDREHCRRDRAEVRPEANERLPRGAEAIGDRYLVVAEALREEVQREHLRVVVVVGDLCCGSGSAGERAEAALAVGDRFGRDPGEDPGQERVADATMQEHALDRAREARPDDVVGAAVEDGADDSVELVGGVLAVGVAEHDRGGAERDGLSEARTYRSAQPATGQRHDPRPGRGGDESSAVGGAVIDDDRHDATVAHGSGDLGQDGSDAGRLVSGREEEDHRPAGWRRRRVLGSSAESQDHRHLRAGEPVFGKATFT